MQKPTNPSKAKKIAITIEFGYSEPWHHECYQGILNYAHQRGWRTVADPMLLGVTSQADIASYDGVVGRISPEIAETARAHGLPMVNHWASSPVKDIPTISMDHHEGARLAGEHLIANGYRRLALVDLVGEVTGAVDTSSLHQAAAAHGLRQPGLLMLDPDNTPTTQRDWLIQMRELLTGWLGSAVMPVGLLIRYSHSARYIVQLLLEMGLRIPEDIGIVALVSNGMIDTSSSPTLSAVDSDYIDQGYQAALLLDKLMQGKPADPLHRTITPTRVTLRDSTDVFLCDDPLVSDAMRLIAAKIRKNLSVQEVADALEVSRRTLERRFDQALKRSIHTEIKRLRIDYIKHLVTETDRALADIAADCSFSSTSYFAKYFRSEVGVAPSAYRKQFKAEQAE